MMDRSAQVAEVIMATRGVRDMGARHAEILRRVPGVSRDEIARGVRIAQELLRAEAGEHFAVADALDAEAERRRAARGPR